MDITVLDKEKRELRIEIKGEGHSFCSALQTFLLKDSSVEFASYNIQHPLIGKPVVYLRTKGSRKPENALIEAAESLSKKLEEVKRAFLRGLEEEKRLKGRNED